MSGLGLGALGFGQAGASPFGGDVIPISWQPLGAQFPAGAALHQSPCILASPNKITVSLLFRVPSASQNMSTGYLSLIDILRPNGDVVFSISIANGAYQTGPIIWLSVAAVNDANIVPGSSGTGATFLVNTHESDSTWPHSIAYDAWHHLFVSLDTSIPANYNNFATLTPTQFGAQNKKCVIFIDGVNWTPNGSNGSSVYVPGGDTWPSFELYNGKEYLINGGPYTGDSGWTFPIGGANIGIPYYPGSNGWYIAGNSSGNLVQLGDVQVLFGQALDPLAPFGNGTLAVSAAGDNGNLIPELGQAMLQGGADLLFALTVVNIEVGFSLKSMNEQSTYVSLKNPQGIFQFNPTTEVIPALAYWLEPPLTWYTNNNYQSLAFFWNSVFWGMTAQQQGKYPDPDGYNRYLVHNQGIRGATNIWNASPSSSIGSLSNSAGMLKQSWAHGMTNSTTIGAWLAALASAWATSKAAATARLSNASLTNINAFFSSTPNGGPAPIMSSAAAFGQPDIQFTGPCPATFNDPTYGNNLPGFLTNQGSCGPFVTVGPSITTIEPNIIIGS